MKQEDIQETTKQYIAGTLGMDEHGPQVNEIVHHFALQVTDGPESPEYEDLFHQPLTPQSLELLRIFIAGYSAAN